MSHLVHGMTASAYYGKVARQIEDDFIWQSFTEFTADEIAELERFDAEIDAELFIPEKMSQKEKVLFCVRSGLVDSIAIAGQLSLPLKSASAWLSVLWREGQIEKFAADPHAEGLHGATHFYRYLEPQVRFAC